MLGHMRTTLDLPDSLLKKAQQIARQRKVTFRALMADALRHYLQEQPSRPPPFKLPDRSFTGDGLVAGLSETDWERIRDASYEGRGS
jgi:putative antitoxin of VapBC-like toxin-antitoxin system